MFTCQSYQNKTKLSKTDTVKESLLAQQTLLRIQVNLYKWMFKPELVRDVISRVGVCHLRYEKRPEQMKSDPNVHVHAAEHNLEEQI